MLIPKKIGRNDPCWCGSGVKYKKCHLDREKQTPIDRWDAAKEFRDKFSVGVCSAPDSFHGQCSSKIIKAHTIPKSSSLNAIAVDGHVYGFKISLDSIHKQSGKLSPELIGVNKASTFTGFCNLHDNSIFSPVEKNDFACTPEQCFLLAYRAFSRECYTKSAMANLGDLRSSLDKGKSIEHQMDIQMKSFLTAIGVNAALKDNKFHKMKFDSILESQEYQDVQAVIFKLDTPPPVMVSGAVNPDFDFNGQRIQDLMELNVVPDLLSMTSFYDGKNGYIVMSWLSYCGSSCKKLINSLFEKPQSDLTTYLVQYIFKNFENCFISPSWWDEVTDKDKELIIDLLADTVSLESDPNGDGIASAYLGVNFPNINGIEFINCADSEALANKISKCFAPLP